MLDVETEKTQPILDPGISYILKHSDNWPFREENRVSSVLDHPSDQ